MVFDPVRQRVVLFGGQVEDLNAPEFRGRRDVSDTWELVGNEWIQRSPAESPLPQHGHDMVFDLANGKVLLWSDSSRDQLWSFGSTETALATSFVAGCVGSAGVPNLAPVLGNRPWLGDTFSMQLTGLPFASFPLLLLGVSDTAWGALPLPQLLDAYELPGCTAYTSADVSIPLGNLAGTAVWTINIPNEVSLVGLTLFAQGLVPDGAANAFGATLSNAAEIRLGGK